MLTIIGGIALTLFLITFIVAVIGAFAGKTW